MLGQIKGARGFRQFLLRGLTQVQAEWRLLCTVHNLLELFGANGRAAAPGAPQGDVRAVRPFGGPITVMAAA